ncbi:MAG: hypothetical protein JST80_02300 [Bdellovibrionales bacterium]|nr:hypothetical protein [Bdellovibrionales bacterium]
MRIINIIIAVGSSVVVSACGGSTGVTSASQALQVSNLAIAQITGMKSNSAPSLSQVPGLSGAGVLMKAGLGCVSNSVASPVDADGDGIPLTQTYTFNCDAVVNGNSTYTNHGTYTLKDKDDTKKWMAGGYEGSYVFESKNSTAASAGTPASGYEYTGKGIFSEIIQGISAVFQSTYSGTVKYSYNGYSGDYAYDGTWNAKWTPDSGAVNVWDKGSVDYSGSWHYAGTFPREDDQGAREAATYNDITMTMKSENLTYDTTCSKYYRSGSWVFDFGDGHVFKWVYDCNNATKYYLDGTLYDPSAH